MIIPFGPFEPDRSKYSIASSTVISNAQAVLDGWGPMAGLNIITDALPGEPRGVCLVRTASGSFQIYAGTETALYKLDTGSVPYGWTDVSRLSGGAYAVPPGDNWSFTRYGSRLIASNLANEKQFIDVDSGTEFANLSNAPISRTDVVAGDFLAALHLAGSPNRARWNQFNNSEGWTLQERGAGLQDFPDGGEIQAGIGSEEGAIIFQRSSIRAMQKVVNVSAAFQFSVLNPYRGTIAPYGVAAAGPGMIFYPSEDGFYMGVEGNPIGAEKVDRWFLNEEVDLDYLQEITSAIDPYSKICWFAYRKIGGMKARIGFNWQLQRWCCADNNVTQIAALTTPGLTWDGLDSLYATIDDVNLPFDSRLFAGGRPTLAGFDSDYKLGWFTGASVAATLETADMQLAQGARAFLQNVRIKGDCPTYTVKVGTSDKPGGTVTWSNAVSPFDSTGICHFRSSGLFHRFKVEVPAGVDWRVISGIETGEIREGTR